ncbi:MAG TPA: hypothetical protein VJP40_01510, partial [bacterium]|nr:hypothetical protein [bacterium]
ARHWVAEGDADQALAWLPASEPEDFAERGLFHEIRARALRLQGHREKAGRALSKAETSYRKAENLSGLARICNLRGSFAKQEAGFSAAENCYAAAVELARQAKDGYCEGSAQVNLALTYQDQGKIDEAHQAYRRAWAISRNCSHPMLSQTLYHNWINLLHHMGRSRQAEKLCYEWLQLAVQHQYPEQQASALNYLALIAGQRKHYKLQGAYLDQAIGLLNSRKCSRLLAQFLINRSLLGWSLGKYFSAQRDAEAALKIHRHFPEDPLMGYAYLVLGKVFRDRELYDYSQAGHCLLRARANVLKNQNRPLLWEVEYNLGLLEKMKGDREAARKFFLFARKALEDLEQSLPEALKESYQRDRKSDRVARELGTQ